MAAREDQPQPVLGEVEVTEQADEGGQDATRVGVVDGLHPRADPLGRILARQRRVLGYFWSNSLIGRTSTLPRRAAGIFEATWMASFRSLALIR
jgi:hypothetical protein